MRIQSLILENFRGFAKLKLDFFDDLNVVIGENGAGKSSVLDALAVLFAHFVEKTTDFSAKLYLVNDDIKNGAAYTEITINVLDDNEKHSWGLMKSFNKSTENIELSKWNVPQKMFRNLSLPLVVYYPVNRMVGLEKIYKSKNNEPNLSDSSELIYKEALNTKIDFGIFFEWFRNREDFENERRLDDRADWRDNQLEAVRNGITNLTGFKNLRVRRNPDKLELSKHDQILNVNQLSDGEKCMMALVGDLARRLAIANPAMQNPLDGRGIVLIDEIELHLHPAWQRQIIPGLRKTFPNCQFIVTTHSPQVLSHVVPEKIFILRQSEYGVTVSKADEAYGKSSDRILEDLMGVPARPAEIANQLNELFRLIDQHQMAKAKELVASLRQKIGEDADLLKADVLIRRKEFIGK
jgi:predicted ATP-binding protein involved in virulence